MQRNFPQYLRGILAGVALLNIPGQSAAQVAAPTRALTDTLARDTAATGALLMSATLVPLHKLLAPFSVGALAAARMPVQGLTSPLEALNGKIAGVEVTRPSGTPGSDVGVTLRTAFGVVTGIPPQVVLDGVWLNSGHPFTVQDLEALDVASIEVLKGPVAAALYGSRGASGVIVIATNRGLALKPGETRFTARNELGADFPRDWYEPLLMHPYRVNAAGQYVNTSGAVVSRSSRVLTTIGIPENRYIDPTYNQASQFFRPGLFNTSTVGLQQNRAATNFNLAYTRTRQRGVIPEGDGGYRRQTLRLNADYRASTWARASVSASHARSSEDPPQASLAGAIAINPDVNIRAADPAGVFRFIPIPDATEEFVINPLNQQRFPHRQIERKRTLLNATVSLQPFTFLSFDVAGSYDRGDRAQFLLIPRGTRNLDGKSTSSGTLRAVKDNSDGSLIYGGPTFQKRFGSLATRLSARAESQRQSYSTVDSTETMFNDAGVPTVIRYLAEGRKIETNSLIGNIGLDYSNRYVADVLVRHERIPAGRTDFPKDLFTRFAAAWLVNNESWFPGSSTNLLKLHAAFGTSEIHSGTTRFLPLGQPIFASTAKGTRTTEREFGIDVSGGSRAQVSLVYIASLVRNPGLSTTPGPCGGYDCLPQAEGSVTGRTVEGTLRATIINNTRGLSWDVLVNADQRRSRIEDFPRTCFTDGPSRRCANTDLNSMTGHHLVRDKSELVNLSAGSQSAFDINDEGYVVAVGAGNSFRDGKSKNLWGTNVSVEGRTYPWGMPLTAFDNSGLQMESVIGNSNADVLFGFQNTIRYRGFQLYTQFSGQLGGDVYNNVKQSLYASGDHIDLDQSGKPDELRKSLQYYRAVANSNSDYLANFVESATHARLAEASIGYEFKAGASGLLHRIGASRVQVDLVGRNLLTVTGYSGPNPAGTSTNPRVDNLVYPTARTFTVASSIVF